MNFKNPLLMMCALTSVAGCGNYSNEDLEFTAALPERADLTAVVPTRSAIVGVETAELYRMSRNVALVFNGFSDAVLFFVDTIRSFPPTKREPDLRVWGPFAPQDQKGWVAEMVMERKSVATFAYRLEFRPETSSSPTDWIVLFSGTYSVADGVRRGVGQIKVDTAPLRAAGVDPGFNNLDHLTVNYTTAMFPITVDLDFANLPDLLNPQEPASGIYSYAVQANGQGALSYDFTGNIIPGIAGVDTVEVTARWLGTGEGRADLQVTRGDALGAQETQCWDDRLQEVYTYKPWAPLENVGDVSACAAIPTL
jgi:hypothetical protein